MTELSLAIKTLQNEIDWRKKDLPRLQKFIQSGDLGEWEGEKVVHEVAQFERAIYVLKTYNQVRDVCYTAASALDLPIKKCRGII
jgi:hypothetical protein